MPNEREVLKAWLSFARSYRVADESWADYSERILPRGRSDEETVVKDVFRRFSESVLGYTVGEDMSPEQSGAEGRPDFTPSDAVTHPFVFEVKGTDSRIGLAGHDEQVRRYLEDGRPRIKQVVLTNMLAAKVYELDQDGRMILADEVNFVGLLRLDDRRDDHIPLAAPLVRFVDRFARRELGVPEKLQMVRSAPEWNAEFEVTDAEWLSARVDKVVRILEAGVRDRVAQGALVSDLGAGERDRVASEMRQLAWRLGADEQEVEGWDLDRFVSARPDTPAERALAQYVSHVAYYTATRLTLVRVWEDLDLLEPILYDGPFDRWMTAFDDVVSDVVAHSFTRARSRYRSLFDQSNNYTWYTPDEDTYANVIYELANTYFGAIGSDVLGRVYERLLERVDRKTLGQYYTPRDVIALIWDLIEGDDNKPAQQAEAEDRTARVLDIAAGSGGFLVEAARRQRERLNTQIDAGAQVTRRDWLRTVSEGLNGVEFQRFPAYLAEINLLIQVGQVLAAEPDLSIPSLGILAADTLSLHNPQRLLEEEVLETPTDLFVDSEDRRHRANRIKHAAAENFLMDVAVGNPPYVGEKSAAATLRRTRETYPYWEDFVGPHLDYLYWFLALGVSKLREGGRFGFITTEYWLRSAGARPLRDYLARRCHIDRIVLFRDMRLFPDAPGQHSMVVVGERVVPHDADMNETDRALAAKPVVAIYEGHAAPADRARTLAAMSASFSSARTVAGVRSFRAPKSPNDLGGDSWSEVTLTAEQVRQRRRLREASTPATVGTEEGVITAADRLNARTAARLDPAVHTQVGWPEVTPGIFALRPDEVASLGSLTDDEKAHLLTVVNNRDVLPYATVTPEDARSVIYLDWNEHTADPSDDRTGARFPANMPNFERHLTTFRPVLEDVVRRYNANRPWWSVHRARPGLYQRAMVEGDWAEYCLTTRWGSGSSLVVGMAPADAVPFSGLHALYGEDRTPSAYICGLLNSTVVQDLAATLPPGNIRSADIRELGLPVITDVVDEVTSTALELAGAVKAMVRQFAGTYPLLTNALSDDIGLTALPTEAWLPGALPRVQQGPLADLAWFEQIERGGQTSAVANEFEVTTSLLGVRVLALGIRGWTAITLSGMDEAHGHLLAEVLAGAAATGTKMADFPRLVLPTSLTRMQRMRDTDANALAEAVSNYQGLREAIDDAVGSAL